MSDTIPTDSVLRRHYEAMHGKQPEAGQRAPQQDAQSAAQPDSGGFFGWLKKIFCS